MCVYTMCGVLMYILYMYIHTVSVYSVYTIHTCAYTSIQVYIHMNIHIDMCMFVCIYVCTQQMCVYVCLCVFMYIYSSRRMAEAPRKRSSTSDVAASLSGRHSSASDAGAGVTLQKQIGLVSACGFIIGRLCHVIGKICSGMVACVSPSQQDAHLLIYFQLIKKEKVANHSDHVFTASCKTNKQCRVFPASCWICLGPSTVRVCVSFV